jgi:hypothetical protein
MKNIYLILLMLSSSPISGQVDSLIVKALSVDKFYALSKRQLPKTILKEFAIKSRHKVGTKMRQCSCTSHKDLVLIWAMTNKKGVYILGVGIPGRACQRKCYTFYNGQKIKDDLCRYDSFEEFKIKSLTKN